MLWQSLLEMLSFAGGIPGSREGIERLGKRHRELDITRTMYDLWLEALCESVRHHDPECTAELERRWRIAMRKGIALMLAEDEYEGG